MATSTILTQLKSLLEGANIVYIKGNVIHTLQPSISQIFQQFASLKLSLSRCKMDDCRGV